MSMLLHEFTSRFPDELSCEDYLRAVRESVGMTCPRCGGKEFSWLNGRKEFQCKSCGNRISLTMGTVMEKSHLPLRKWFYTAHLITSVKQVISAKEVEHQLGMDQYPPVWLMMMKYRDIMGKRDAIYKLRGSVELDEMSFPTYTMGKSEENSISGNTVIKKNAVVAVLAESKPVEDLIQDYFNEYPVDKAIEKSASLAIYASKKKVQKFVHYIKMFVMPDAQAETIEKAVKPMVDENAKIVADGARSHYQLKDVFREVEMHQETMEGVKEVVNKNLPWVHIVAGDCRNGIAAIHKEVDERFLQLYLNEYCWKFNRRCFREPKAKGSTFLITS